MRIGLITTLNTNLGDDLVREGIGLLLREFWKGEDLEFIPINKHRPFTVYQPWHPLRWVDPVLNIIPQGRARLRQLASNSLYRIGLSRFDGCDLIVQCGTPVAWFKCANCEWAEPLWHHVVGRLSSRGTPILNLGAGSCYPWEYQPAKIEDDRDAIYLSRILSYCRLTTVRDQLAQRLFGNLGHPCTLLPCPAFLAAKRITNGAERRREEFVVINYMERGGHYDGDQFISLIAWREAFTTMLNRIRRQHKVVFLCHSRREDALAKSLDPTIPRIMPTNPQEYFTAIAGASVGICNRLHAVAAMAGVGIPSVAVGTDSRLLMVEALGLPFRYVKDVTGESLSELAEHLLANHEAERNRLLALRDQTWEQYMALMRKALQ